MIYDFSIEALPAHVDDDLGVQVLIDDQAVVLVSSSTLPGPETGIATQRGSSITAPVWLAVCLLLVHVHAQISALPCWGCLLTIRLAGIKVGPEHGSGAKPFTQPQRISARSKRAALQAHGSSSSDAATTAAKRSKGFAPASAGYHYVNLEQARRLPARTEINVYAIVTDIRPVRSTSGTDSLLVGTGGLVLAGCAGCAGLDGLGCAGLRWAELGGLR